MATMATMTKLLLYLLAVSVTLKSRSSEFGPNICYLALKGLERIPFSPSIMRLY
jgi:hypothetical protein